MTNLRATLIPAAVCVLTLCAASASTAQQSFEVFAGYSYLRDPSHSVLTTTSGDDNFPIGWAAGVSHPIWRAVSIVAEASGHYARRTTFDDEVRRSVHAFAAGPRASAAIGPFTEFVEALVGAAVGRAEAFGATATTTGLLLQGGGGIDYPVARRLAARVELDYRRITGSSEGRAPANQLRALAAIVVR